jgi:hypothetical protein
MQNPIVLESDGRKPSVQTRSAERCPEKNLDDMGELEDDIVITEELC